MSGRDDDARHSGSELVAASDGLPARLVGPWAQEKLFYVGRYIDIFTTGMKDAWPRRVYLDLFSGPGLSVIDETNEEIDGTPLLALKARYPFTQLYLNDADHRAIDALDARLKTMCVENVILRKLDCNAAARDAIEALSLDKRGTLGLAVIDPTAFQISLDAISDMTRGRQIDLIITVMTGYLKRFIDNPTYERPLDEFFGSTDWRKLIDFRASGHRLTFRRLLDHYEDKLKALGYEHVDDDVRILNRKEATIYHLVFASKHPRGHDFFKKISDRRFGGQRRLF